MPIFGEKPFTSITVKINQLCKPNRNEDLEDDSIELYVTDLLELIKLQLLGATEAARAVRKKIKYGNNAEEQLLALSLLELLVLNAGPKIGQVLASDDKLLDLLRNILGGSIRSGLGTAYDKRVVQKLRNLAIGWKSELADLDGYKGMANLWKSIPRRKKGHMRLQSASIIDQDEEFDDSYRSSPPRNRNDIDRGSDDSSDRLDSYEGRSSSNRSNSNRRTPKPPRPSTASPYTNNVKEKTTEKKKKNKKTKGRRYADEQFKIPQINYKVEAPKIRNTIAECYTHTTALNNYLLALPTGSDPLNDDKVAKEFEKCRKIRRAVLRYLQYVGAGDASEKSADIVAMDEEFLGSLIVANEQLVSTFQQFDKACGYTAENPAPAYHDEDAEDDDSDESYYLSESDTDLVSQQMNDMSVQESSSRLQEAVKAPPPPRPQKAANLRSPPPEREVVRPPAISKTQSYASVESGDPFGDSNEVRAGLSRY